MSRLYRYFLTTALLVLIAVFSTFIFYPQNLSDTSEYEQNRTYVFVLLTLLWLNCCF